MNDDVIGKAEAIVSEWNKTLVDVILDYLAIGLLIVGFGVLFRRNLAEKRLD